MSLRSRRDLAKMKEISSGLTKSRRELGEINEISPRSRQEFGEIRNGSKIGTR